MTPKISVLMTAYNRASYIGAAIESVLAQTERDFELVVVDDRSTDDTVAVASAYLSDPRVRIARNERNLGDYPNRNHAATLARGRFIKYHDSDDVMYPHCLETMVSALEREPSAAFALTSGRSWSGGPCPMLLTPRLAYLREFHGYGIFQVGPAAALFRAEEFFRLGRFPEEGPHSDFIFWCRACARANLLLVCADLFWYRVHDGQHRRTPKADYDLAAVGSKAWSALCSDECPLTGGELELAKRNAAGRFAREIVRDFRARHWRLGWYRMRHCGLSVSEWLRYARRPRADLAAGTPLSADGEYLVPDVLRRPPAATAPAARMTVNR